MSRTARLFDLLQVLRRHRFPVRGAALANEVGVSLRTLYRDIATLQSLGAPVEGEAGLGYVLRPGFVLPPLMFSRDEIEALVLGSRWVAERADEKLALAARDALAKIAAVLPAELREELACPPLLVGRSKRGAGESMDLSVVRQAIRAERKLEIIYRDPLGVETQRTVWPFALGFFEQVRVIAAWCELRDGFRHFRTDRIVRLTASEERYPRKRRALLLHWREREKIPAQLGEDC